MLLTERKIVFCIAILEFFVVVSDPCFKVTCNNGGVCHKPGACILNFQKLGVGTCLNADGKKPVGDKVEIRTNLTDLSSNLTSNANLTSNPLTCAEACVRIYGDQCMGFDTRGLNEKNETVTCAFYLDDPVNSSSSCQHPATPPGSECDSEYQGNFKDDFRLCFRRIFPEKGENGGKNYTECTDSYSTMAEGSPCQDGTCVVNVQSSFGGFEAKCVPAANASTSTGTEASTSTGTEMSTVSGTDASTSASLITTTSTGPSFWGIFI